MAKYSPAKRSKKRLHELRRQARKRGLDCKLDLSSLDPLEADAFTKNRNKAITKLISSWLTVTLKEKSKAMVFYTSWWFDDLVNFPLDSDKGKS